MGSGYWQVVTGEGEQERLELFTPDGKIWWNLVPMGILNTSPKFVAMAMKLKKRDKLSKEREMKYFASKIIVDDVFMYICTSEQLPSYF